MAERPAPLVGVVDPGGGHAPFGSYAAVALSGQSLLAADLSRRLGSLGVAVTRLAPTDDDHWGRWYARAMRAALHTA